MATNLWICIPEYLVVNSLRFQCVALCVVGVSLDEAVVAGMSSLPPALGATLLVSKLFRNKTNITS